jgi:hypothetical protein
MRYGILISACSLAGALLVAQGCQKPTDPDEIAKLRRESADEIAKIRLEADNKIAEAQRAAALKTAEATKEAQKDIAQERKDTAADIVKERLNLEMAIRGAKQTTMEEYKDFVAKRGRLSELREAALKAGPKASEHTKELADMDAHRETLKTSLNELDKATVNTWQAMKGGLDTQFKEIEQSLNEMERGTSPRAQR